jgi:GntR family transcriptional regulator
MVLVGGSDFLKHALTMPDETVPRFSGNTPLYLQVARNLRVHIASEGVDPGSALPSERDLSELLGMSRVTVRKGIEKLIEEGILFRKQGSGTFVARRIVAPGAALSSFSDDARSRGESPGIIWVMRSIAAATDEEAELLEIPAGGSVARLGRIRLSNGEPLAIEHAVVPAEFLPDVAALGDSLYEALAGTGARPVSGIQRIRASQATPIEAGMLAIGKNAEVLRIERVTRNKDGRVVELTRSAYRGDRFEYVTELSGPVAQR